MKILHIAFCGKSEINGVINAVNSLATAQKEITQTVVGTINSSSIANKLDWKDFSNGSSFRNFIYEYKPDLVIFNSLYFVKYIEYSRFIRKCKIPYIVTFHGGASRDNYKKHKLKKWLANHLLFNEFIKKASKLVYLNEGEHQKSIFKKIKDDYVIIPNGISSLGYSVADIFKYKSKNKIKILFLSRLDVHGKGLDVLYDALKIISNSTIESEIHFDFCGYSPDGFEKRLHELGRFVSYHGIVKGREKDQILLESNIMILPSRSEGMPLTVLEALAYGMPAIVTPETNLSDIIENNNCGWTTSLNPEILANIIIGAVHIYSKDMKGYIERCVTLSTEYNWNKIAINSIKYYSSIVY